MTPWTSPAVVFPGQGSQGPAMGEAWQGHPGWSIVREAEDILQRALEPILLDPAAAPATTTDAQLSVVLCSVLSWEAMSTALRGGGGCRPLLAGHSLGFVSALHAAGVLTLRETIEVVALRARITEAACDGTGGMTALLLGAEGAHQACADVSGCWVANDNAPSQTVISGTYAGLRAAESAADELGASDIIPLDVAGPFHTPLMHQASREFLAGLRGIPFTRSQAAVVHNGRTHRAGDTGPNTWRELVAADLITPVRWCDTQHALARAGADAVIEAGHGRTLTGLAKRTLARMPLFNAASFEACEALAGLVHSPRTPAPSPTSPTTRPVVS